ncbi:sensor histidine kinase [Paenibacillus montanisoli]|uniref:ATP-binding protein n=1 Tax=Paenibacillus montanisoli TaxID=2081970 RepID=UPI00105776DC|nr:sensor histidine kinase [Paenibacillus montanisoli]
MAQSIMGNYMFICIPSILYFVFWTKYGAETGKFSKIVLFLFLSTTLLLCMSFPYHYDGGFLFDFRLIPLVLGILYGGPWVGAALLAILITYRYIIGGGDGFYIASIVAAGTYFSLLVFLTKYRLNSLPKIFRALIVSTALIPITIKLILFSLNYITYNQAFLSVAFRVIEFTAICITVYLIEFVSNHFKLQMELKEIEKMRVISQIAASVSHEIRNPLTTVKGLLQLFKEKELPTDKRANLTEVALNELSTAINIISDYLTFAKPQIAKLTPLDLTTELQHVVSVLTPYANMQQVTLTIELESDLSVLGDSQQLRQSLINLVKNCIEASSNGRVEIAVRMKREYVIIRIQDTGSGMTADQILRLGTPYYSTKEKGTGLGTMVAFSIIKAMNGSIHVESEINKGSVFEISFPGVR